MSLTILDGFSVPALRAIGIVHTSRSEPTGTPLQPRMASGFRGEVEVLPEYEEGLMDIEGFTRIWLLVLLHRAAPAGLRLVPYRDTVSRGVFATRAPARPNGLGISAVKLLGRERNRLFIDEVDLLDGTPLIDLKPYIPEYDCYPEERSGWLEESEVAASVIRADGRFHKG
jgi:tRNA-Thr(GGU) m(6)t(6)A37 methyltransferase TsaA